MQDSVTKLFVQRLLNEQGFREAAQQAFRHTDTVQSNDILQRCRALNASLKQACEQLSGVCSWQQQRHLIRLHTAGPDIPATTASAGNRQQLGQ